MKISARRLRQKFPFDLSTEDAGRVLTATGLEVEGIERVEDIPGGLRGVVVGHVMEVTSHPDADRLRLCKVDAGEAQGVLDIVCGASNVAAGQKVPLATIGTMVPMVARGTFWPAATLLAPQTMSRTPWASPASTLHKRRRSASG